MNNDDFDDLRDIVQQQADQIAAMNEQLTDMQQRLNALERAQVPVEEKEPENVPEVERFNAMDVARRVIADGCANIQIPTGANPAEYRSLVALKAAALLNESCEGRTGLVHSNGALTCQQEQKLTGVQDNNDNGKTKGGKAHLQYYAEKYEKVGESGSYTTSPMNKTQKAYMARSKGKCLLSLNKLKKDKTLGKKQGGVWKYILLDGEENEDFYDRINVMMNV